MVAVAVTGPISYTRVWLVPTVVVSNVPDIAYGSFPAA